MKYLMYYRDGFIRKYGLTKPAVTMGRGQENDLIVDEDFVSRSHLTIDVLDDHIVIHDRGSTNGTYVNSERVEDAIIKIGESFTIKGMAFYLKEGSLSEFQVAKEIPAVFQRLWREDEGKVRAAKTRYVRSAHQVVLKQVLSAGMRCSQITEVFAVLSVVLPAVRELASLVIVADDPAGLSILFAYKSDWNEQTVTECVRKQASVFCQQGPVRLFDASRQSYSYPLTLADRMATIIHTPEGELDEEHPKTVKFLRTLAREVELISHIISDEPQKEKESAVNHEHPEEIVTHNQKMIDLCKQARRIAAGDIGVLIEGDSGTGKELLARLIHRNSKRAHRSFIGINCAAIPESLLESELFGHEKGAFTGAHELKKGKFELASSGTLVLDEIGDMPLPLQAKLLRALEEREFFRLGGTAPIRVDIRIISLTHSDMRSLINEKRFREDLYYRLAQHVIHVPPLRERTEDIPALINYFAGLYCRAENKSIGGFSQKAYDALLTCPWPGNVRQLKNEIQRLVSLIDNGEIIDFDLLSDDIRSAAAPVSTCDYERQAIQAEDERTRLIKLLDRNHWNKSKTARELGITNQGLWKRLKRLNITTPE
ncbi:MAG: sigma 54-interacting transcriptional regulator [Acidobacteriota bacterium]